MIYFKVKKNKAKNANKQVVLVVIKPDGMDKFLMGEILQRFCAEKLEIIAAQIVPVSRSLAEAHYKHIKGRPFYRGTIEVMQGKFSKQKHVLAMILLGSNAIAKCRDLAGATNPQEADPRSIRGAFGRVTPKGLFENVVHVSSDPQEAEREIKLWFSPDQISIKLYPTKKTVTRQLKSVWA